MSKDANSFGHDKALAWESRGFVYTKRGCIVSTHPLFMSICMRVFLEKSQANFECRLMILHTAMVVVFSPAVSSCSVNAYFIRDLV